MSEGCIEERAEQGQVLAHVYYADGTWMRTTWVPADLVEGYLVEPIPLTNGGCRRDIKKVRDFTLDGDPTPRAVYVEESRERESAVTAETPIEELLWRQVVSHMAYGLYRSIGVLMLRKWYAQDEAEGRYPCGPLPRLKRGTIY